MIPYVEQWSFYVQRQLPSDMVLSVGYVGTHGLHLFGDEFRSYDHVPTALRLKLRDHINDTVPTPAGLVSALWAHGSTKPAQRALSPVRGHRRELQPRWFQPLQLATSEV